MRKKLPLVAPVALITIVFGALVVRLPMAIAQRASDYSMFDPVVDVQRLIANHFIRELDDEDRVAIQEAMIDGMIEVLDDRYTEYIPAKAIADFDKQVRGEYAGIGAEVLMDPEAGWLKIVSPMEDSPAFRSGIEADDFIVAVDGKTTHQKDVDEVIDMLMGPPGSAVNVTIERSAESGRVPRDSTEASVPGELGDAPGPGEGNIRFDLEVVRARIVASTIKGIHRNGDQWSFWVDPEQRIAYIRVTQFTGSTIPELTDACHALVDDEMQGLILDLRFNGGGSLFAAIQMADLFLDEGMIVSTRGRAGEEEKHYAGPRNTLPDFPMIVLVNAQSASASEIVSGALQDDQRAAVLGERTFGKGVVQTIYRLPSGSGQLKITEQYYYLPSGRLLHRTDDSEVWGVDPNDGMYVPMTTEQYRQMLRVRREEEIIRADGDGEVTRANWNDPAWILEHLQDLQLTSAVDAIRGKLGSGTWPKVSDVANQAVAMRTAEVDRERERIEFFESQLLRSQRRLEALATTDSVDEDEDLIPVDEDLTGGKLLVYDPSGKTVATLEITGPNLEAWLEGAPLETSSDEQAARSVEDESPGGE